jgi:hypothetical protein
MSLVSIVSVAVLLAVALLPFELTPPAAAIQASGQVLAPVGRQVGWLSLSAPRRQVLTSLNDPAYVTDVAATLTTPYAAIAVASPLGQPNAVGDDLLRLDTTSSSVSPLLARTSGQESLDAPAWWPDGSGLLFERDDLTMQLATYAGESTPRFASRIETIAADGTGRSVLVGSGRMPAAAPDGSRVALVQTTSQGTGLVLWSRSDGSQMTLVAAGEFADVAYPRFSPAGDQVAFLVPEAFVGGDTPPVPEAGCARWLFGPCVALAHGLPWDLWVVGGDGSGARELAAVGADDGSVAWSPDGASLLVYGGGGGFLVDASSGNSQTLGYLAGYGSIAWLSD